MFNRAAEEVTEEDLEERESLMGGFVIGPTSSDRSINPFG